MLQYQKPLANTTGRKPHDTLIDKITGKGSKSKNKDQSNVPFKSHPGTDINGNPVDFSKPNPAFKVHDNNGYQDISEEELKDKLNNSNEINGTRNYNNYEYHTTMMVVHDGPPQYLHDPMDIDTSGLASMIPITNPELMGLTLGDLYGLTYDSDKILNIFNDATNAKYKAMYDDFNINETKYLQNILANQFEAQHALQDTQNKAVATGASNGMLAANQLSSMLGWQEQATDGAYQLAAERNNLSSKARAELAENVGKALEMSNTIKQVIANLDSQKYGYDMQGHVADIDYNANVNQALANVIAQQIAAAANSMYQPTKVIEGAK